MKKLYILLTAVLLCLSACDDRRTVIETLHHAEAVMMEHPDSALQLLERIPHPDGWAEQFRADYALLLTQARSRCRIIATSDSLIRIAVNYYLSSNNNARKAKAWLYLGDVYMDMQKYSEAIIPLKQAEEVMQEAEANVQSLVYSKLGYLNRKSGNYELALEYYQKTLRIDMAQHKTEWIVSDLTNILNLPLLEIRDSAAVYIGWLEENILSAHPDLQAKTYNNIGVYYNKQGQQEQAAQYFHRAIHASVSAPYRAYLNLARIYDAQGDEERADSLFQAALQSPVWATRALIYKALSNRNINKKKYQEAVEYMKRYQAAADSFYTHRQALEIQKLQLKYDNEVMARDKAEAESHLLRLGSGVILLLWVLASMGYYLYRYFKNRHLSQLQKLENQIIQIRLLEDEKEQMKEKVRKLNDTLAQTKALNMEYLKAQNEWTTQNDLQALALYIRLQRNLSLYNPSLELPILGHWLDIVSGQFASRLRKEYPYLTVTELSVCYFQRMNYTVSDMSQALHVKIDSISRYIYRICSKLDIPKNKEQFYDYILHF